MINSNDLFYTCSLIEYISRKCKQKRTEVINQLGKDTVARIYKYADTFHCEMIETVATNFIEQKNIPTGNFDNVAKCKYEVPSYWDIGKVYARLIEELLPQNATPPQTIQMLYNVYFSFINDAICNYNSDFFYQPHDYIAECYREQTIL